MAEGCTWNPDKSSFRMKDEKRRILWLGGYGVLYLQKGRREEAMQGKAGRPAGGENRIVIRLPTPNGFIHDEASLWWSVGGFGAVIVIVINQKNPDFLSYKWDCIPFKCFVQEKAGRTSSWDSDYIYLVKNGHGSSFLAKGAGASGEALESGRVNISNPSTILVIGISDGGEGACGHISTEKGYREARRNDDPVVSSLRVDVDRGGSSRESEGLVDREERVGAQELINARVDSLTFTGTNKRKVQSVNTVSPSPLLSELVGSLAGLGRGPGCHLSDEEDGPSLAPGFLSKCTEQGGLEIMDRGSLSLIQSRGEGFLCSGPNRIRSSGGNRKSPAGSPTSSGLCGSCRFASGVNSERACQIKSRLKKVGRVLSIVKLGVGAHQFSSGGLPKPRKKKKIGCTSSRDAIPSVESEQRGDGVIEGSISDSNIANMNRLFLQKVQKMSVVEIWDIGQRLGVVFEGEEGILLAWLDNMEARDSEAWNKLEGGGEAGSGVVVEF
ncbi:hypothetical protein Ancab_028191 [Ancistrocladus abbreviatus]